MDSDDDDQIKAPPRKIPNEYEGVEINREEELANDPQARELNQLISAKNEIEMELLKQEEEARANPWEITSEQDMRDLLYLMKKRVGSPFCTNVLRVALNQEEEIVASALIAYYKVHLDKKMIVRALKTKQMEFLYCVWAFNKNYELKPGISLEEQEIPESESDEEKLMRQSEDQINDRAKMLEKLYYVYTYDFLIKQVLKYCQEDAPGMIKQIAEWKLLSSENVLQSLLTNRQDEVACAIAELECYSVHAHVDLMIFCLQNQNEKFLKFALNMSIFSQN
jgi:hypothetical protein